ncbi:MAG: hypothetical protein JNJ59_15605, partial [Deltaproteobacteria bacterium]|nr:hypothetical protein [Deltaproteobacteria bacterium]
MRRRVQSPERPITSRFVRTGAHALFALSLASTACGEDNQGTDTTINDRDTTGDATGQANWQVIFVEPAAGTLLSQLDPFSLRARIEPRSSGETVDLLALSASIAIDGVPDANHRDLGVSSGLLTRDLKLPPGAHTITLTVSSANASASADLAVVINTPPDSPTVTLSSDAPGASENVVATGTGPADTTFKAPQTELTFAYVWKKVDADTVQNGATLPSSVTEAGDTWEVTVTADDGFGPGLATVKRVTIGNSAPSCDGLVLLPASARTTQDITCKCLGWKDADGDTDQSTCVFIDTVSGATLGTDGECTLPASLTASGMSITCTLTPFDGATSGTAVQTASGSAVSIVNSPPGAPTATLTPTTADANTTLTCSVATPGEDPDHDTVTHTVAWTVDNSATTATGATLVPSAAGAGKGDKVCCIVTAGDGSDSSPPSAPACVTLDNAGPTLESVFLQT